MIWTRLGRHRRSRQVRVKTRILQKVHILPRVRLL